MIAWARVDDFLHDVGVLPTVVVGRMSDAEFDKLLANVTDHAVRIRRLEERLDAIADGKK